MSNHDPKQIQCYVHDKTGATVRENLQKVLNRIYTDIGSITGGTSNYGKSPDEIPATPNTCDDEFEEASLDTTGVRFSGATAWTWYQQQNTTFTQTQGSGVMLGSIADSDSVLHYIGQPAPSTPWTLRARVAWGGVNPDNARASGIVIHNTGNGRYSIIGPGFINASKVDVTEGVEGTGIPNSRGEIVSTRADICLFRYVELENDGTNLYFRYSGTGVDGTFIQLFTRSIAGFMGAVTNIGLGFAADGGPKTASLVINWFRRVA